MDHLSQTALIQGPDGKPVISHNIPLPAILPTEILIKTIAVGLNPMDYKIPTNFPSPGAIIGCDLAGTVASIGSEVAHLTRPLNVGDRVCGGVHGSNALDHESGAFAEYVKADARLVFKIPDSMSWEEAATLGVAIKTVSLSLWRSLRLEATPERPTENPFPVLVYGGSTTMGTMAIQMLKLSGLTPIATCSPRNFALVKSFGAEQTFDYSQPGCAADIKSFTKNSLKYVLDCITDAESIQLCYAAIGRAGGRYSCLEIPPQHLLSRKAVKADFVMPLKIFGKRIALGGAYERAACQSTFEAGVELVIAAQKLLDCGQIRCHPPRILSPGFGGILEGLDLLKRGQVSGQKLVVRIS
jgi:NADPH:quinone reductase-like Zn-dependent oxidoreductase